MKFHSEPYTSPQNSVHFVLHPIQLCPLISILLMEQLEHRISPGRGGTGGGGGGGGVRAAPPPHRVWKTSHFKESSFTKFSRLILFSSIHKCTFFICYILHSNHEVDLSTLNFLTYITLSYITTGHKYHFYEIFKYKIGFII